jgi:hypothetical protein
MTAPLFPPPTFIATVAGAGSYLAWILICGVVALAVARVVRRPADDWPHGMWSKIGWILVIAYVAIPLGGYLLPLGAAAAMWRTRRPPSAPPAQLPYADGDTGGTK